MSVAVWQVKQRAPTCVLAGFQLVGAAEWPAVGAVGCRQGGVHQRLWHGNWQRDTRRRDCYHSVVSMFGAPLPTRCISTHHRATDAFMLAACCQEVLAVKQSVLSGGCLSLTRACRLSCTCRAYDMLSNQAAFACRPLGVIGCLLSVLSLISIYVLEQQGHVRQQLLAQLQALSLPAHSAEYTAVAVAGPHPAGVGSGQDPGDGPGSELPVAAGVVAASAEPATDQLTCPLLVQTHSTSSDAGWKVVSSGLMWGALSGICSGKLSVLTEAQQQSIGWGRDAQETVLALFMQHGRHRLPGWQQTIPECHMP